MDFAAAVLLLLGLKVDPIAVLTGESVLLVTANDVDEELPEIVVPVLVVGVEMAAVEPILDVTVLLGLAISVESLGEAELRIAEPLDCVPVFEIVTGYTITAGVVTACVFPATSVSTPVTIDVVWEYRVIRTPASPVDCATRDASLRIEEGRGFPFVEQSCWREEMKTEGSNLDSSVGGQDLETQIRRPGRNGVEDVRAQRPVGSGISRISDIGWDGGWGTYSSGHYRSKSNRSD